MAKEKDIFYTGRFWILLGIAMLLSSELFFNRESLKLVLASLASQVGIALIVMGIVAIIMQFQDMKAYFQERLKDIVIQRSYLESLSDSELTSIQTDTLKAKYKNTDIDRDGSFLYYFQGKIQDYLKYPYRESVNSSILVVEDELRQKFFKVFDSTNYTCRANNDNIQDEVKWLYGPEEFEQVYDVKLILRCPSARVSECDQLCGNSKKCSDGVLVFDKAALDATYAINDEKLQGYLVTLKDVIWTKDQLHIELITCYAIKKDNIFTWSMTHPSRDITFTISYPAGYKLNPFVGGIETREYTNSYNGNMYIFKHEGWFLPMTGLAWNLVKVGESGHQGKSASGTSATCESGVEKDGELPSFPISDANTLNESSEYNTGVGASSA